MRDFATSGARRHAAYGGLAERVNYIELRSAPVHHNPTNAQRAPAANGESGDVSREAVISNNL
jgi:hypothetical protein